MKRVAKLDYLRLEEKDESLPLQPNGFLSVLANLTRTGVFTYFEQAPDGTIKIIRQLRLPEEVFSEKSMSTLIGLPTTVEHPSEEISTENAKDYIVGMTSDVPKKVLLPEQVADGETQEQYIQQRVTFFNKDAIDQIRENKKREFSLGYTCFLEDAPGEWNGEHYDYIQRDIEYNHLSLVDRARGGAKCAVVVDGIEVDYKSKLHSICDGMSFIEETTLQQKPKNKEVCMKKLIIDGKEIEVSDEVYASYMKVQEKAKLADSLEAERDSLKSKIDKQDSEEELKKKQKQIDALVQEKTNLIAKASKIIDSKELTALSNREIMEKVITKVDNFDCKDKSDDYVSARFDFIVDSYKENQSNIDNESEGVGQQILDAKGVEIDANKAREKAWQRDKMLWTDSHIK